MVDRLLLLLPQTHHMRKVKEMTKKMEKTCKN